MSEMLHSIVGMSFMMTFSSFNYALNLDQTDSTYDLIQTSTPYFQQECHLYGTETELPINCNY